MMPWPYFGGRILNLLQMITGELEGRSGKSVRVSELRRTACCGTSRPPACLCGFLLYLRFTGYEGMKKKKLPGGRRQEVPESGIKVCSGRYWRVDLLSRLPRLGPVFCPTLRLTGGESSSHCTARRTKCAKQVQRY